VVAVVVNLARLVSMVVLAGVELLVSWLEVQI
jgi:hypothetical protein